MRLEIFIQAAELLLFLRVESEIFDHVTDNAENCAELMTILFSIQSHILKEAYEKTSV
jgi:hypothetical protein